MPCVEKSQYELCIEVLSRLDKASLLKDIVLVGSWCTLFYEKFFGGKKYMTSLTTRDMDLLIPDPKAVKAEVDVAELFFYPKGYFCPKGFFYPKGFFLP